jgi:hypothetical protein
MWWIARKTKNAGSTLEKNLVDGHKNTQLALDQNAIHAEVFFMSNYCTRCAYAL